MGTFERPNSESFFDHPITGVLNSILTVAIAMKKVHRNSFLEGRNHEGPRDLIQNNIHVCVLLNSEAMQADVPVLVRLWDVFDLIICADGGANRLYDGLQALDPNLISKCVPTFIKGDLDSVRSDVESFYRNSKCRVVRDPDQDTNDLEKCLQLVQALCQGKQPTGIEDAAENADGTFSFPQLQNKESSITVVVFGAFGGRFDQQIATLHAIYLYADYFQRLVLLGDGNCATLLHPGTRPPQAQLARQGSLKASPTAAASATSAERGTCSPQHTTHTLHLIPGIEGPSCSLLPVGGRCDVVSTTGLKWNLASQSLALGELISTSNRVMGRAKTAPGASAEGRGDVEGECTVTVQCSQPVLWCCQVNLNNACVDSQSCI